MKEHRVAPKPNDQSWRVGVAPNWTMTKAREKMMPVRAIIPEAMEEGMAWAEATEML